MSQVWFLVPLFLSGCLVIEDKAPPDLILRNSASIQVSSGGILGQSSTTIFGDDRVVVQNFDYGKSAPPRETYVPGAFERASAVIRAEGARTTAKVTPDALICMDYGTDLVQATPPIAGFDSVSAGCPNDAVNALLSHVLAAIAP